MFPCGPGFFGGVAPPATDPYWSQVVSLLHFDGVDGSGVITDSKGSFSWNETSAAITTAQFKFGGASILFGSLGGSVTSNTATGMSPTTHDFAIEFWWRPRSAAAAQYRTIFQGLGSTDMVLQSASTTSNALVLYSDGATVLLTESSAASSDVWHFYKLSRYGTSVSLTRDGVTTASATVSSGASYTITTGLIIGAGAYGGSIYVMDSWMDDFRLTVGTSRPGSGVPTAAFPNM